MLITTLPQRANSPELRLRFRNKCESERSPQLKSAEGIRDWIKLQLLSTIIHMSRLRVWARVMI